MKKENFTFIFKNSKEFYRKNSKENINGVTQEFLDKYDLTLEDAEEMNKTNMYCFNCLYCNNCYDCENCNTCYSCENCIDCFECTNCTSCDNCEDCEDCYNCYDSKYESNVKDSINLSESLKYKNKMLLLKESRDKLLNKSVKKSFLNEEKEDTPSKKELTSKYVFYDNNEFEEKAEKNQNGVSKKYLKIYYKGDIEKWYNENKTNKNCFDCNNCTDCINCKQCFDCKNCDNCSYTYQCENCKNCYNCIGKSDLTDESNSMDLD